MPAGFDRLACVALSIKRGKAPKWVSANARKLARENSEAQLSEWCKRAHR